jgi:hypothetical protein
MWLPGCERQLSTPWFRSCDTEVHTLTNLKINWPGTYVCILLCVHHTAILEDGYKIERKGGGVWLSSNATCLARMRPWVQNPSISKKKKKKKKRRGLGCSLVIESLPSIQEALGSFPTPCKKKKSKFWPADELALNKQTKPHKTTRTRGKGRALLDSKNQGNPWETRRHPRARKLWT